MAVYSRKFTVPANTTKSFNLVIEGDIISYIRYRYPSGSEGLLKFAVFYGLRQIFPYEENTWFYGEDEWVEWNEYYELPEYHTELEVKAVNEDDTYDHSFFLLLITSIKENMLENRIAKTVSAKIKGVT